jgi:hypothetical protein
VLASLLAGSACSHASSRRPIFAPEPQTDAFASLRDLRWGMSQAQVTSLVAHLTRGKSGNLAGEVLIAGRLRHVDLFFDQLGLKAISIALGLCPGDGCPDASPFSEPMLTAEIGRQRDTGGWANANTGAAFEGQAQSGPYMLHRLVLTRLE